MSFTKQFLAEVQQVTAQLDETAIEKCADELAAIRDRGGRLFILGVGGSAGNVTIGGSPACAVAGRGQGVVRCGK